MAGQGRDDYTPVAEQIPFDNDTNDFDSDNVQDAIEESQETAKGFPRAGLPLIHNGTVSNNDLISYSNLTPNVPIVFPVETQINEVTFSNDRTSVECDIELWLDDVGGSGTLAKTLNISTGGGVTEVFDINADNVILSPGQILQLRYIDQGTNARDMAVVLWISRVS